MLISQPEPSSGGSPYHALAQKYGYDVEFRQLIQTVHLEPIEFRAQRLDIRDYTAIVFTSKTAMECFFALLKELRITLPETTKYFCPSEAIALYLQKFIVYRKRKVFFGERGAHDEVIALMQKPSHAKEKYLIPTAEDGLDALPRMLADTNLNFTPAVTYRTITRTMAEPLGEKYDIIVFFSPFGIRAMQELCSSFEQGDTIIGAFGTLACQAVKDAGWRLDVEYTGPTEQYRSMSAALDYFLENKNKQAKKTAKKSSPSTKAAKGQTA